MSLPDLAPGFKDRLPSCKRSVSVCSANHQTRARCHGAFHHASPTWFGVRLPPSAQIIPEMETVKERPGLCGVGEEGCSKVGARWGYCSRILTSGEVGFSSRVPGVCSEWFSPEGPSKGSMQVSYRHPHHG